MSEVLLSARAMGIVALVWLFLGLMTVGLGRAFLTIALGRCKKSTWEADACAGYAALIALLIACHLVVPIGGAVLIGLSTLSALGWWFSRREQSPATKSPLPWSMRLAWLTWGAWLANRAIGPA